jgi:hypothetical protein
MLAFIERLSKSVSSHLSSRNVLEVNVAVLNLILDVVVVDINMLRTLMMTLRGDKLNRRLIVADVTAPTLTSYTLSLLDTLGPCRLVLPTLASLGTLPPCI